MARQTAAQKKAAVEAAAVESTGSDLVASIDALLPDLVQTKPQDFEVDSRDILAPRIKAASPASEAVSAGLVPLYSLFAQKGQDDEEPQVLVEPVKDLKAELTKNPNYGVKVYVLKMYKNLSASVNPADWSQEQRQDGELRTWRFGDPGAPQFAKVQYNYVLFVPESDDNDMPHNLLLKSTSISTARQVNSLLFQRLNDGRPLFTTAFRLVPEKRERERGGQTQRWAVIRAREVDATVEEIKAAAVLAAQVADREVEVVSGEVVGGVESVSEQAPAI